MRKIDAARERIAFEAKFSSCADLRHDGVCYLNPHTSTLFDGWLAAKIHAAEEDPAPQPRATPTTESLLELLLPLIDDMQKSMSASKIIDQQIAIIDSHRAKRLERRLQNEPVEVEKRSGYDRRQRSEGPKS